MFLWEQVQQSINFPGLLTDGIIRVWV